MNISHFGGWKDGGDIIFKQEVDKVRIIQADPKVWISDEIMRIWYTHPNIQKMTHIKIQWINTDENRARGLVHNIQGSVVTFLDDFGAKYIYVIREFRFPEMLWLVEWPD